MSLVVSNLEHLTIPSSPFFSLSSPFYSSPSLLLSLLPPSSLLLPSFSLPPSSPLSPPSSHRHDVKERDVRLHRLGTELHSRTGECERLQKIVNQHQRTQDHLRQEVEYRMFSLRVSTMAGPS